MTTVLNSLSIENNKERRLSLNYQLKASMFSKILRFSITECYT